jgi:hypothetical protein
MLFIFQNYFFNLSRTYRSAVLSSFPSPLEGEGEDVPILNKDNIEIGTIPTPLKDSWQVGMRGAFR